MLNHNEVFTLCATLYFYCTTVQREMLLLLQHLFDMGLYTQNMFFRHIYCKGIDTLHCISTCRYILCFGHCICMIVTIIINIKRIRLAFPPLGKKGVLNFFSSHHLGPFLLNSPYPDCLYSRSSHALPFINAPYNTWDVSIFTCDTYGLLIFRVDLHNFTCILDTFKNIFYTVVCPLLPFFNESYFIHLCSKHRTVLEHCFIVFSLYKQDLSTCSNQ